MTRWTPIPVAGGAYVDDALPWSAQDTVNYIPVMAEKSGTRSPAMLRGLPGCTTFSVTGSNAPVRGARNVEGKLLAVSGNSLYRIATTGAATVIGTIPGVGRVSITHNQVAGGNEVVIGNGQSGYVYNTALDTLTQITDEAFPGFKVCDFVDGYIAGVEPQGRYWFISDLAGGMLYNSLDRQEAESQPDGIVSLIVSHGEVFVLGERSGEFYRNTGAATGTFQRIDGTEMDVGCAGTHARAKLDNSVFWVGSDGIGYRLNGYQPVRITTHAIEQAWSRCNLAQAFCTVYEDRGHKVWYVTFPDGKTWGYDVATGEWHRRKSDGLDRWRMNTLTYWQRSWIAGDYSNGKLYQLDWAIQHENGAEMERRRAFPVMHDDQNRLTVNAIEFVFDTGLSEASTPLPVPLLSTLKIMGDLPDAVAGALISPYTYTVSGGVLPYGDRTISAGALPTGLVMSTAGVVTGTPTVAGTFSWTVRVTDANGDVATVADSATVIVQSVFAAIGTSTLYRGDSPLAWPSTVTPGITSSFVESRGGRLFALASGSGRVSADGGTTWVNCTGIPAISPVAMVYAAATWILVVNDGANVYVSTDGVSFSARALGATQTPWSAIAVGNTVVVATANSGPARRSIDGGLTWANAATLAASVQLWAIANSGTAMVAVSGNGNTYRSTNDGATWSVIASGVTPASIAYGNARFVIITPTGTTRISTDDGLTYSTGGTSGSGLGDVGPSNELIFTHGLFVAACSSVGSPGIYTSADGAVWTNRLSISASSLAVMRAGQ